MAQIAAQVFISYVLSQMAASLLKGEKETPLIDEKPGTSSTRGGFISSVQGARRLGPMVGWVGNRNVVTIPGSSGGKGGGVDSGSQQRVYHEDSWHVICIGPATRLLTIWANGEKLNFGGIISAESSPSGSQFQATGQNFSGQFRIFWGEKDQPVNANLATLSKVGILSRWPFICYVEWINARLGGFAHYHTGTQFRDSGYSLYQDI